MGKALVLAPVEGKPDWYLVKDDLGVQYQVQSGVEGYPYAIGKEYRLFTPGGLYEPRFFRLLPFGTARRWRSARATAKTHPATAAAMHLYNDKLITHQIQDRTATIESIQPYGADTTAVLVEGGRAIIQPADAEVGLYGPGDSIAVIHDPIPGVNEFCLKKGPPKRPWVAGTGGKGPPKPHDPECRRLNENWSGYSGVADLSSGSAVMEKAGSESNVVRKWTVYQAPGYTRHQSQYGALNTVSGQGGLAMSSQSAFFYQPQSDQFNNMIGMPCPALMPLQYDPYGNFWCPPVVAIADTPRKLVCGKKELWMNISNLQTFAAFENFSQWGGGAADMGVQLPSCMILVFNSKPYPFISESDCNPAVVSYSDGSPAKMSRFETNMDQFFKLVYVRPPNGHPNVFEYLRAPIPGNSHHLRYGLKRSGGRRFPDGSYPVSAELGTGFHYKFNVPMEDPELGFGINGMLLKRCFDVDGVDVTPICTYGDDLDGYFPGYFELPAFNNWDQINVKDDFLAAYPFMANPARNPLGKMPRLSNIVFWSQGSIADSGLTGYGEPHYQVNPTGLTCDGLSLFYMPSVSI